MYCFPSKQGRTLGNYFPIEKSAADDENFDLIGQDRSSGLSLPFYVEITLISDRKKILFTSLLRSKNIFRGHGPCHTATCSEPRVIPHGANVHNTLRTWRVGTRDMPER